MRKISVLVMFIYAVLIFATYSLAEDTSLGTLEYFYSADCKYCQEQKPIMDKWIADNPDKVSKIKIEKVDISVSPAKAVSLGYNKQGIPYFQVRNQQGEIIATGEGNQTEEQLSKLIDLLFSQPSGIEFIPDKLFYKIDGKEIKINAAAFVRSGRTYVPVRYLGNSLGIEDKDIVYSKGVVTLKAGDKTIELKIGQETIKIDGVLKEIDAAPFIEKGYTFLPAKYVAEALGYKVDWKDNKVIISSPVNKVLSKSIPDPVPVYTEREDKYYDFEEMLVLGGLKKEAFLFEKEDVIILNDNHTYSGIVLNGELNKIYLVGKDGQYFKYDLANALTRKDGKWLVKNDDVLRIGMLGSILKGY